MNLFWEIKSKELIRMCESNKSAAAAEETFLLTKEKQNMAFTDYYLLNMQYKVSGKLQL